ncbi:MAG TPA: 4-hydroxybenzoate octaprenyltransferase [Steroidobacteraceae bacterium]|nr:4-hydroxybenzoate octaprenyltransferase [Steroidobacteraceae bacterium]
MAASVSERLYGIPAAPLLRRAWAYAQLMRLDKPIGILLLLWPTLWALWIAARALPGAAGQGWRESLPSTRLLLIFIAGTVVMRSAGCVINDFADRNIDPHVKRTRGRPLASRRVSPYEALTLFGVLVALALLLVTRLDQRTVYFSLVGAALTISYPFMKRFFALPQFYLGAAFGWAVPMAFVATLGSVPRVGWVLFIVTLLWAGVYDTIYGMVDRDDDIKLGVQSTAIAFGDMDTLIIGAMQLMVLGGLLLAGRSTGLHWPFHASLIVAAALFAWQQWLIRNAEREACFKAFLNNHWVGLVVMIGVIAGR